MHDSATKPARSQRWAAGLIVVVVMALVLLVGYNRRGVDKKNLANANDLSEVVEMLLYPSPTTVVPGIHLLGGMNPAAVYVVETSEGLMLIDTGLEPDAGALKRQMAELDLDWKRIRAILLTHAHADHSGGAQRLRAATGAKIYAGWGDAQALKDGGPPEALFGTLYTPTPIFPTTVDVELKGDTLLQFGDVRCRALAAPGHSPGSVCYLVERDGLRILFAGDVIMSLASPPNGTTVQLSKPLGTYATYVGPRSRGDAKSFLRTLRRLRAMPVPNVVLPGHPNMSRSPQNPALSQARWEALLDEGIGDMETLLARRGRDGAGFLDGTATQLAPNLYYFGDFQGTAVYGFLASSKFFLVATPRAAGLLAFVKTRSKELGLAPSMPTALLLTSSESKDLAGLDEFIEKSRADIVVSPDAVDTVTSAFPKARVVSADYLPNRGWFDVKPMVLRGWGLGSMGYNIRLGAKATLFSGSMPIRVTPATLDQLFAQIKSGKGNKAELQDSFKLLSQLRPDIWLPATVHGQSANLYDDEWQSIVEANQTLTGLLP